MMTQEEIVEKITLVNELSRKSQLSKAKEVAIRLIELPEFQLVEKNITSLNYNLGTIHGMLSELPEAMKCFEICLEIYTKNNYQIGIAATLGNIGLVHKELSNFSKALECYEKALSIYEFSEDKKGVAYNLANIGVIFKILNQNDKAMSYFLRALEINQETENKYGIASNYVNLGSLYANTSEFSKALFYYENAYELNKEIEYLEGMALNLGSLGNLYNKLKNTSKAQEFYEEALSINRQIGSKVGIAYNLLNLSSLFRVMKDSKTALQLLNECYELSKEIQNSTIQLNVLEIYSQIYSEQKKYKIAFQYLQEFINLKESTFSEETKRKSELFDQKRQLEEDEKARQLKLARFQEQERIFHNILPVSIANRLIEGEKTIAESFENVSIFFSDIVGFTSLSSTLSPDDLVKGLNKLFTFFDRVAIKYGLEKIKTIGDAYMAVCGVPDSNENHAYNTAKFALEIQSYFEQSDIHKEFNGLQIRIGIHCGNVVAGIIGERKFAYDVWGDAVNIASRMESTSEPNKIQITNDFVQSIAQWNEFSIIPRGEITIKGKGTMNTFWLEKI